MTGSQHVSHSHYRSLVHFNIKEISTCTLPNVGSDCLLLEMKLGFPSMNVLAQPQDPKYNGIGYETSEDNVT